MAKRTVTQLSAWTTSYEQGAGWIALASQKHYVSFYTCAREHIQPYIDRHPKVKCGTGCLNFRDKDDIVLDDLKPVLASAFGKTPAKNNRELAGGR